MKSKNERLYEPNLECNPNSRILFIAVKNIGKGDLKE